MIEAIVSIGYGLLLGSLVGIEREKRNFAENATNFAGVRTYSLISFLGACLAVIGVEALTYIGFVGVISVMLAAYFISNRGNDERNLGVTSEIAVLIVFLVGYLAGLEEFVFASVITAFLVSVLGFKEFIHNLTAKITRAELESVVKFIIISAVVLPLLPNEVVGPLGVLNPYKIWLLVVLIAGISALSYLGIRIIGYRRGIGITGFLGGLVSSTAVTLSFSKLSKDLPKKALSPILFGLLVASAAMYFRVLFEVSVVNINMLKPLAVPMIFGGLTLTGFGFYFYAKKSKDDYKLKEEDFGLKNPVDVGAAVKFGGLFALILILVSLTDQYFGEKALLLASALSGMVDTDAISLSLASLAKDEISIRTATLGVLVATSANMIIKTVFVWLLGSPDLRKKFAIVVLINLSVLVGYSLMWIL
jgi:uncharacterized membrane protein (DUF4010 family)